MKTEIQADENLTTGNRLTGQVKTPAPAPEIRFKDIIVVVHGIGEQKRAETVRSVATRLAVSQSLSGNGQSHIVAPQPLGYFHSAVKDITTICRLDDLESLKETGLATIGFAEVYWADIPEEADKEGRTLEETKAWARTVIARAKALCQKAQKTSNREIIPPDFNVAVEVLEEIIETVYVLENLFFLAGKVGVFKFDLRRVLEEYLGDVQIVTEFANYRTDILARFHAAMESIYKQQAESTPDIRLHIVAHSEGTVISFLGLLMAMSKQGVRPSPLSDQPGSQKPEPPRFPDWLKHVKGYMTLGSPIDKHLLLWPRLWRDLDPQQANDLFAKEQIHWRNYYDYGDPVGFELDTARLWLKETKHCTAFEFEEKKHDIGFARYLLPGEAHNEYWSDPGVFEHFITDVVRPPTDPSLKRKPPRSRWYIFCLSPILPYFLSFILLNLGVFILYKAVHVYTHPSYEPLQRFVRFTQLGLKPSDGLSGGEFLRVVVGLSFLIAGATLLARIPRLAFHGFQWPWARWGTTWKPLKRLLACRPKFAIGPLWLLIGVAAFVLGCFLYQCIVPDEAQQEINAGFALLRRLYGNKGPSFGVIALAAVAGLSGYLVMSPDLGNANRGKRWLLQGMRPLILCGAIAVALMVILQLSPQKIALPKFPGVERELSDSEIKTIQETRLSREELDDLIKARGTDALTTLLKVQPILVTQPSAWPVALAGAAFLYLWWLSTLIFDLAFVWQRYIRHSVSNKRLQDWNPYGLDFSPKPKSEATPTPTVS